MTDLVKKYTRMLLIITLLLNLAQYCNSTCSSSTGAQVKTYTLSSWEGVWFFSGFAIGPSSGDYYHMLLSLSSNQ